MSEVHHKGISNVQLPLSLNSSLTSHCSLGHNLRVLQAGITSIFLGLIMSQQNLSRKFLQIDIIEEHYSTWVKSRKQTKKSRRHAFIHSVWCQTKNRAILSPRNSTARMGKHCNWAKYHGWQILNTESGKGAIENLDHRVGPQMIRRIGRGGKQEKWGLAFVEPANHDWEKYSIVS